MNDEINNIYIFNINKIISPACSALDIFNSVYNSLYVSKKITRQAKKSLESLENKFRYSVRDFSQFPEKVLISHRHSPKEWCKLLLKNLIYPYDYSEIGSLHISYNASSHTDLLPNLATQVVLDTGLELAAPPEELLYLGCASALFSLKSAVKNCQRYNKPSVVIVFEQCTWLLNSLSEIDEKYHAQSIRTNLLFNDGAVGFLLIPESWRAKSATALPRIEKIRLGYSPGNIIKMVGGQFLTGRTAKDVIPALVSEEIIIPMLEQSSLLASEISEWSIHQGGIPILDKFSDSKILGLSDGQLRKSRNSFEKYSNMSSASAPLVLHDYFHNGLRKPGSKGMMVGFGAGYYMGAMLYKWD